MGAHNPTKNVKKLLILIIILLKIINKILRAQKSGVSKNLRNYFPKLILPYLIVMFNGYYNKFCNDYYLSVNFEESKQKVGFFQTLVVQSLENS